MSGPPTETVWVFRAKERRRRPRMAFVRRQFLPPWLEKARHERLEGLSRGRARRLFNLVVDRMIDNAADEPWCDSTELELRLALGCPEEDFQRLWATVRPLFVWRSGKWWWPPLERADTEARKSFEMQDARNILGGHCATLGFILDKLKDLEATLEEKLHLLERFVEKQRHVIFSQERLLEAGGKIATRPWLLGAKATAEKVLISMSDARRRTYRRLLLVGKQLGYSLAHVKALFDKQPKLFRDLALRHRFNVLTFNALHMALKGELEPWAWGADWEKDDVRLPIVEGL